MRILSVIKAMRVAVLVADFYKDIADGMRMRAVDVLHQADVEVKVLPVPGAFELPAALRMAMVKGYDGYIVLGCVIRGETEHYRYVCDCCCSGIMRLASEHALALGFGVLTVETKQQAEVRLDYGKRAAKSCLAMMALQRSIDAD